MSDAQIIKVHQPIDKELNYEYICKACGRYHTIKILGNNNYSVGSKYGNPNCYSCRWGLGLVRASGEIIGVSVQGRLVPSSKAGKVLFGDVDEKL